MEIGLQTFVPEGQMTVARRFIAGVRDPMACLPGGTPEFGAWGGISPRIYPVRRIGSDPDPTSSVPPGRRSYG